MSVGTAITLHVYNQKDKIIILLTQMASLHWNLGKEECEQTLDIHKKSDILLHNETVQAAISWQMLTLPHGSSWKISLFPIVSNASQFQPVCCHDTGNK